MWSENEIDYLLVSILPNSIADRDLLEINHNEVSSAKWSCYSSIERAVAPNSPTRHTHTPWFRGIVHSGILKQMWKWAESERALSLLQSEENIKTFRELDSTWDRKAILNL